MQAMIVLVFLTGYNGCPEIPTLVLHPLRSSPRGPAPEGYGLDIRSFPTAQPVSDLQIPGKVRTRV